MAHCNLCPAACGADRRTGTGACGGGAKARVAKYGLHPYEEPCLSAGGGAGTVFFSGCALRCVFCQNYTLSHGNAGREVSARGLCEIFEALEGMGAANIELVTASHYLVQLLEAFRLRRPKLPVVYNTHAYETLPALRALDSYVDVWLPDLKFYAPSVSARYTGKADYFARAYPAVAFMAKREAEFDGERMVRGCIVRHLVLPLNSGDSVEIVKRFAALRSGAYLSLMGQYTPCGDIAAFPELSRPITRREYERVLHCALGLGIERLFAQKLSSANKAFIPDFSEDRPLF